MCSAYTPVYDAGPSSNQHWFTVLCMLGHLHSAMWFAACNAQRELRLDYRCSANQMRINACPASVTSDQYCIGIGSTHRGCWVDLKPCGITILMVTEYHHSLSSSAVGCSVVGPYVQIILTSEVRSAIEVRHDVIAGQTACSMSQEGKS